MKYTRKKVKSEMRFPVQKFVQTGYKKQQGLLPSLLTQ